MGQSSITVIVITPGAITASVIIAVSIRGEMLTWVGVTTDTGRIVNMTTPSNPITAVAGSVYRPTIDSKARLTQASLNHLQVAE